MAVDERAQLLERHLSVALQLIDVHLCQRQLLAGAVDLLHQLQAAQHVVIVFLVTVELCEHAEYVATVAVVLV